MSLRMSLALMLAGLLGVAAAHGPKAEEGKLRCSLTDRVIQNCCCVERDGKTHCTLAGKDVESCCCRPAV